MLLSRQTDKKGDEKDKNQLKWINSDYFARYKTEKSIFYIGHSAFLIRFDEIKCSSAYLVHYF